MRVDTMKIIRIATYALMALFMLAAAAYAGDLIPASKVIEENSGLFQWILGLAILASLYLVAKMIKTSEANNDLQWKAINSLNTMFKTMHDEFIEIKTEHRMNHKEKKHEDKI
jgi:hypothetical protein